MKLNIRNFKLSTAFKIAAAVGIAAVAIGIPVATAAVVLALGHSFAAAMTIALPAAVGTGGVVGISALVKHNRRMSA